MGCYRYLLAVLVVLSHIRVSLLGMNVGVLAVVSFFLLSGFVMTALIDKYYLSFRRVGYFYADRAFRLFPQYLVYLLLTVVFVLLARPDDGMVSDVRPDLVFLNVLMLPLGLFKFIPDLSNCLLIPQAWTLGLELCFYLLIPLILIVDMRKALSVVSVAIFTLACFGVLDTDMFGYRLLPGNLFIFLIGSFMYDCRDRKFPDRPIVMMFCFIALLLVVISFAGKIHVPYSLEMTVGILAGVPIVWMLRRQRTSRIDTFLGNLSYGVFLNHYLLKWAYLEFYNVEGYNVSNGVVIIAVSTFLSYLSYHYVEMPVIALRHKWRNATPKS